MDTPPFTIEQTYNTTVEKVWKAITDKDEMRKWFFDLQQFNPIVGFSFEFYGKGSSGQRMKHLCQITEVKPLQKLVYSWRYEGYPGISYVDFELFPEGSDTRLRLTHIWLETFPDEPDFNPKNFATGWTELTGSLLKSHLNK